MFTGIIQQLGRVADVQARPSGASLTIDPRGWCHRPQPGESIAVDGCCLTVAMSDRAQSAEPVLRFDVIHQTLQLTTLGGLRRGDAVNLEHAATPATLLGGHIVQGHVDGVARIARVLRDDAQTRMTVQPPAELMEFIVPRGSVALNGVSLTIASVAGATFDVALIPTTLEATNLGRLSQGTTVNLEVDYIAKIIIARLRRDEIDTPNNLNCQR